MENNKKACMLILAKVMEDPQSGSCPNVSYADISGPVANYNPTGSPFAHPTTQSLQTTTFANTANLNSSVAGTDPFHFHYSLVVQFPSIHSKPGYCLTVDISLVIPP